MNLNNSFDKPKVSNLTKNLQQHNEYYQHSNPTSNHSLTNDFEPNQPHESHSHHDLSGQSQHSHSLVDNTSHHNVIPQSMPPISNPQMTNIHSLPNNPPSYQSLNTNSIPNNSFHQTNANKFNSFSNSQSNSLNYLPSNHNTPNIIGSSYSSNNSYNKIANFNPSHSIPTTNINLDNNIIPNFQRNNLSYSVPSNAQFSHSQSLPHPSNLPNVTNLSHLPSSSQQSSSHSQSSSQSTVPPPGMIDINYIEPDHYMSYHEFYHNLTTKPNDNDDGDHLNIIDYPVNDLILMLSCLLTKIIEANDKLHPNHFDNTIAIRQKLKQEKRNRRQQRMGMEDGEIESQGDNPHDEFDDDDDALDDEDDEMKNKYLANVLAFHGTNVPGISLHAYLSRVLKYCPVTNEVFLSLLVYFDRIAKKANNLKKGKDQEQLFVMDSYNIHRLIISGITISSKFFSDIFYKNLRYAKVGGLPLEELNYLELQFLLLLDFKLMISVEDLQNYGDLLLRFWKREQITNQLINNDSIIDNQQ